MIQFTIPEIENWQLLDEANDQSRFNARKQFIQMVTFVPFCLYRHYGSESTSMWKNLEEQNYTDMISWLSKRLDLFARFTGHSIAASKSQFKEKIVLMVDPFPESKEIIKWLKRKIHDVSAILSLDIDILDIFEKSTRL